MTATADYSDGKVPKNETAFPLCSAMDSLWNKKQDIINIDRKYSS